MKHISYLLAILWIVTTQAQAQIKLRLQSDDVVESGFMTTSNANVLLGGLNNANTGLLNAIRGGTGHGNYAYGDLLYANGTGTLARLPAAQGLLSGGATPAWQNTSAGIASALSDETGSGGNGKVMFSSSPTLVDNSGTGAGFIFDGNVTATRAFLGMNLASDNTFRLYSYQTGTNVITTTLTTGATTFSGPISATAVSPQVAGMFYGGISVVNNKPTTEVAADFTNMSDTNLQVQVTGAGAATKFSTIGSSTDTAVQLRQANQPRIILETDDSVTFTNPSAGTMILNFTDANHAIVGRQNNITGFANHYYAYGGSLGNVAGHRFFTGGVKAAQTAKLEIADDGVKASAPLSFNSFTNARVSRENAGVVHKYAASDLTTSDHLALTADNALSVAMGAGEAWDFEFWVPMKVEDSVMNMRTGIIVSQTPQYIRWKMEVWHTSLLLMSALAATPNAYATTGLTSGQEYLVIIRGTIESHATLASSVSFAFMQDAASALNLVRVRGGKAAGTRLN